MIRWPTGSKLHRTLKCPASAILPLHTDEDLDARTEPARGRGSAIHKFLEQVRAIGLEAALSQVPPEVLNLCRALDIDKLPTHLATEVAFAWNWKDRSARELGRNLGHRDYDALGVDWSCEIPCTVDVCGAREVVVPDAADTFTRGFVGDYKSGHTRYPRPERFAQLLIAASCVRSVMGCQDIVAELLYIDDEGQSFPVRDLLDEWALDAFEMELAQVMGGLPELDATYQRLGPDALPKREGSHCDHCPSFMSCNAKTALVKAVPEEFLRIGVGPNVTLKPKTTHAQDGSLEYDVELPADLVTATNAAAVWEACERVKAIVKRMQHQVTEIAWNNPVELSDGRVFQRYVQKRSELDGPIAAAVLERHFPREEVLKKTTIKISLGAVRELAQAHTNFNVKPRPVLESQRGDGVVDKIMAEIAAAKGLGVSVSEHCKPRMPRKKR